MRALEEYLFAMEAGDISAPSAAGLIVLSLAATAGGTCGVTTPQAGFPLPVPLVAADGSWRPVGLCPLPDLIGVAALALWRPAWGADVLPLAGASGQASLPLMAAGMLPQLFFLGGTGGLGQIAFPLTAVATSGAGAALSLPVVAPYGLSGCNRQGVAVGLLPLAVTRAWSMRPGRSGAQRHRRRGGGGPAVPGQCRPGPGGSRSGRRCNASIGRPGRPGRHVACRRGRESGLCGGCRRRCLDLRPGHVRRGYGDCEDGAILLHGLLLAAGLPADRLVTAFGRVGTDRQGHVWLTYRRVSDGYWVVLDWTAGPAAGGVTALPAIGDVPYYATVDYALTAQSFFAVRQSPARLF